jgi:hypothetical protein
MLGGVSQTAPGGFRTMTRERLHELHDKKCAYVKACVRARTDKSFQAQQSLITTSAAVGAIQRKMADWSPPLPRRYCRQ